ncbi:3-deoxy-manno-octulosonate cytidylyltransferase [Mariniblastus fucicola]|uniref:3-deoxy-manno-octulosonate cytidylyltransferase n=1 Tax=Mariniblastus fucicola TaxID=980251 RepID=A0A5B9P7Q4_9BACT|nr:3-deoxy-manno-octulosonate cytidylyltransferase [Mariniblastus fucicola]QEG20626.1 3-deoxy-manno-octulosonate cytidylyltransferase [Mariniblastus fucicola]
MAKELNSVIVVPARRHSTRLPEKMLLAETGKPLIVHTVQSAALNSKTKSIIVATDDQEIFDAVQRFGAIAEMTSADHASGTDRVAEVAQRHPEFEVVVNLQGDEPEISADAIDLAISILEANPNAVVATLATPIRSERLLEDPACVKVVVDGSGQAMYFSRSPIPHARTWSDELLDGPQANFLQHVGLYAYRRDFLLNFPELPPCPTEKLESLEQLRVLSAGYPIHVGLIDEPVVGIDTREDYELFVRKWVNG